MKVGYARTSTIEQAAGLEAQLRDLKAHGVDKIFSEQLSSVDAKRAQLDAAIDYCRQGDVLVCCKLDRLARSVSDLVKIEERLKDKGATICILDPTMDTSTANGRLMFNVIGSVAQFERDIMLARQREGIDKAKRDGKYKGRAPTARAKAGEVVKLLADGVRATDVAKQLGIGRRSVYRIIDSRKNRK
jgi:DNA invertase Pin-like site-specific DNA recombinase